MSRPNPKSSERDQLTEVISAHKANITYVDITNRHDDLCDVYFELTEVASAEALVDELNRLEVVSEIERTVAFSRIFGKAVSIRPFDKFRHWRFVACAVTRS